MIRKAFYVLILSSMAFHRTENISPCMPLAMILVFKPRPNRPATPSVLMTARTACTYVTPSVCDCYVYSTILDRKKRADSGGKGGHKQAARSVADAAYYILQVFRQKFLGTFFLPSQHDVIIQPVY